MRTRARAKMAKAKRKSGPGAPRPAERAPKKTIAGLKGTEEFGAWLDRLARFKRLSNSSLLEHAIIAYARAEGFDEEPPER